ncbi:hypothetical protein RRU94_04055 [Domibacillus sp. DTU_2020_1001157_1_SI_ALB_TIR_016]|uniref:hypothetical protein n=1 Tax=Domibacillus sp. DTU_2020_1001157_1_SI_ALB_TIR_016 TaxID=3077789 RepID=UPI0028E64501|nr:hypothetical protein [Domibacillus sp. DTU_2020_1001157_1_SI_ALB_TIR_016]WNS79095.1 hypothetical protein RRU94_04055 [Domibacillus sp. DTU_2020_1001157_1_SI_ALB_TIR_016]
MEKTRYCLAKDSFGHYVYGETEDVLLFIKPNQDIEWKLHFYVDIEELLHTVKNSKEKRPVIIIDLL